MDILSALHTTRTVPVKKLRDHFISLRKLGVLPPAIDLTRVVFTPEMTAEDLLGEFPTIATVSISTSTPREHIGDLRRLKNIHTMLVYVNAFESKRIRFPGTLRNLYIYPSGILPATQISDILRGISKTHNVEVFVNHSCLVHGWAQVSIHPGVQNLHIDQRRNQAADLLECMRLNGFGRSGRSDTYAIFTRGVEDATLKEEEDPLIIIDLVNKIVSDFPWTHS
jgi:hypothetical protein